MKALIAAAALVLTSAAGPSARADSLTPFHTPSGNIHCLAIEGDEGAMMDCEIIQITRHTLTRKRPADCDLDWGSSFSVGPTGKAGLGCVGDTVMMPDAPVLGYGDSVDAGPFTCTSVKTGMTCMNAQGHGFTLSRARQQVF